MTASTTPPAPPPGQGSFLATGRGRLTLALLCAVTFLDVMDGAIVNVALQPESRGIVYRCPGTPLSAAAIRSRTASRTAV